MSGLTITSDHPPDLDVIILRLSGTLTTTTRHDLRRAVQKHLVAAPAAIILDLADVELVDRIAGATFVAIRRDAATSGPGVPVLISAHASVAERIRSLLPRQPIFATVDDAVRGVNAPPTESNWILARVAPGLQAPFDAMAAVVAACQRWGLDSTIGLARATTFNLCLAAFACAPGRVSISLQYEPSLLRICFRVRLDAEQAEPQCSHREQPRGFHHRVTPTSHILWTMMPVPAPETSTA